MSPRPKRGERPERNRCLTDWVQSTHTFGLTTSVITQKQDSDKIQDRFGGSSTPHSFFFFEAPSQKF